MRTFINIKDQKVINIVTTGHRKIPASGGAIPAANITYASPKKRIASDVLVNNRPAPTFSYIRRLLTGSFNRGWSRLDVKQRRV